MCFWFDRRGHFWFEFWDIWGSSWCTPRVGSVRVRSDSVAWVQFLYIAYRTSAPTWNIGLSYRSVYRLACLVVMLKIGKAPRGLLSAHSITIRRCRNRTNRSCLIFTSWSWDGWLSTSSENLLRALSLFEFISKRTRQVPPWHGCMCSLIGIHVWMRKVFTKCPVFMFLRWRHFIWFFIVIGSEDKWYGFSWFTLIRLICCVKNWVVDRAEDTGKVNFQIFSKRVIHTLRMTIFLL